MSNEHSANAPGHNKTYTIVVDLMEHQVKGKEISYCQVAQLAYPNDPISPDITYTITYLSPKGPDGELRVDESVTLHEGMIFNVGKSNRS